MTPTGGAPVDHRPGLDGLRAVAVSLVVLFHLGRLPGGFLGVDLFFALSGWLITWRLLAAAERSGTIDLKGFWSSRARRLVPASLAVIVTVLVVWPLVGREVAGLGRDAVFSALWVANWGTITAGGDYWARFGDPSPLAHFWSLAIEEQFYVVWPALLLILIVGGRRVAGSRITATDRLRRHIVPVALVGAAVSVAVMVLLFDPGDRTATYMNTAARLHTLLIGAAAGAVTPLRAAATHQSALRFARPFRLAALPAAVTAAGLVAVAGERSDWLYGWGFPLFAVAATIVVVAVADGVGAGVLGRRWLRWIGDRSYGIYLWHWPVFVLLDQATIGGDSGVARVGGDVTRVAVTLAVAHLSYTVLETPIRARRVLCGARGPIAAGAALAAVAVLVAVQPSPAVQSTDSVVTLPATSSVAAPAATDGTTGSSTPDATPSPGEAPAHRPRVLVAGDSTAVHLAEELLRVAAAAPDTVAVGSAAFGGCGLSVADDGRRHEMTTAEGDAELVDLSPCADLWAGLPDRVRSEGYDTVLVSIGPWDGTDIHLADGTVVSVADPVGRSLVADAYATLVAAIDTAGARVVWVVPPDVVLQWGAVESPMNDPARWAALRAVVAGLGVEQLDLPAWLADHDLSGSEGRPDGVHLAPAVLTRVVDELVLPTLLG